MDVVGARFEDLAPARAAREAILASVAMAPADIAVRRLGTTSYDQPIDAYLLAGRFPASALETVVRVIRAHGGTVISQRTEWRSTARSSRLQALPRRSVPRTAAAVRKRPRRPAARRRVRAAHGHR